MARQDSAPVRVGSTSGLGVELFADLARRGEQRGVLAALRLQAAAADVELVDGLLHEHLTETGSPVAERLLRSFDPERFMRVTTRVVPEPLL